MKRQAGRPRQKLRDNDSPGRHLAKPYPSSNGRSRLVEMDSEAQIAVGNSSADMPIPLVKTRAGWLFDLQAGEITLREIGRNELAVIKVASAFVDAQREYSARDWNDGVREYARKIVSAAGRKDDLYWLTRQTGPSPLGPLLAGRRRGTASATGKLPRLPLPYPHRPRACATIRRRLTLHQRRPHDRFSWGCL